MPEPPSIEGQLWLAEFRRASTAFTSSIADGSPDEHLLEESADCLDKLFERCPDFAPQIIWLAIRQGHLATYLGLPRGPSQRIVETGLEAALVYDDPTRDRAIGATLLSLTLAEFHMIAGKPIATADAVERANWESRSIANDIMAPYINLLSGRIQGILFERNLEYSRAAEAYKVAVAAGASLMDIDESFKSNWFLTLFGELPSTDAQTDLPMSFVGQAMVDVSLGQLRTDAERSNDEIAQDIDHISRLLQRFNPGPITTPLDAAGSVAALTGIVNPDRALTFANSLLGSRRFSEFERVWRDARALVLAELSRCYATAGDIEVAHQLSRAAVEESDILDNPVSRALAMGNEFLMLRDDAAARGFVRALDDLGRLDPLALKNPQLRMRFDAAVGAALAWAFEQWRSDPGRANRVRLALLLDSLREQRTTTVPREPWDDQLSGVEKGLISALDRFERIHCALALHDDCAVLAFQSIGDRVLVIWITSRTDTPMGAGFGDDSLRRALTLLADEARFQLELTAGAGGGLIDDSLVPLGQAAYDALPAEAKTALSAKTVLIVPDPALDMLGVPYEMLRDDLGYLGITRAIARVPSLHRAARVLESPPAAPRPISPRSVIATVPDVPGQDVLRFADIEGNAVEQQLGSWEVARVGDDLTCSMLVDSLENIDLLHVVAHGERTPAGEALLLSHRERLTPEALRRRTFRSLPFVFINSCSLGHGRYLGGGIVRGIPHSLTDAGSPAVVACLTPVEDVSTSRLAAAFYAHAESMMVGQALARARAEVAARGVPAALWGTTVLLGHPDFGLANDLTSVIPEDAISNWLARTMAEDAHSEGSVIERRSSHKPAEGRPRRVKRRRTRRRRGYWRYRGVPRLVRRSDSSSGTPTRLDPPPGPRYDAAIALSQSYMLLLARADSFSVQELDSVTALADEVGDVLARALIETIRTNRALIEEDASASRAALEAAMTKLESVWYKNDEARSHYVRYVILWSQSRAAGRGQHDRHYGPKPNADMQEQIDSFTGLLQVQAAVAEWKAYRVEAHGVRPIEDSVEDVLWNAYVLNYPGRIEAMRESAALGRLVALKLVRRGFLSEAALPWAPRMLTGILRLAWDLQDLLVLRDDITNAWVRSISALVDDIASNWSPYPDGALIEELAVFDAEVFQVTADVEREAGAKLHDARLRLSSLGQSGNLLLEGVQRRSPKALGACAAYVLGTLIECNSYSPFGGPTHETINDALCAAYRTIADRSDGGYFYDYQLAGFGSALDVPAGSIAAWISESRI